VIYCRLFGGVTKYPW